VTQTRNAARKAPVTTEAPSTEAPAPVTEEEVTVSPTATAIATLSKAGTAAKVIEALTTASTTVTGPTARLAVSQNMEVLAKVIAHRSDAAVEAAWTAFTEGRVIVDPAIEADTARLAVKLLSAIVAERHGPKVTTAKADTAKAEAMVAAMLASTVVKAPVTKSGGQRKVINRTLAEALAVTGGTFLVKVPEGDPVSVRTDGTKVWLQSDPATTWTAISNMAKAARGLDAKASLNGWDYAVMTDDPATKVADMIDAARVGAAS